MYAKLTIPDVYKRQVPDDAVQIIVHDMAVKIAFLHLPQFQRPHIEVIFSGRIFAEDGLPGDLHHQIHLLHPHIGDPVDTDFHIHHQPPEVWVGSQFAEKPVVDFAAPQKVLIFNCFLLGFNNIQSKKG